MIPNVGIGYVIIPSDIDRAKYLKGVYSTGVLMIRTEFQDTVHSCRVTRDVIERLKFPKEAGQLGTTVVWVKTAFLNMTVVVGTLPSIHDKVSTGEESQSITYDYEDSVVNRTIDGKEGQYTISIITDEVGLGYKVTVSSEKTSSLEMLPSGQIKIYGEEAIHLSSYKEMSLSITQDGETVSMSLDFDGFEYTDRFGNEIFVDENGVRFITDLLAINNSLQIGEGDSLSPVVKYDPLVDVLSPVMEEMIKIGTAINTIAGPTVDLVKLLEARANFITFKSTKTSSE